MSPLFMDTGYEPHSPGSESAEESHSNNAGSEREGEGKPMGKRGTKRQEKNRDAARRSRKKQTERADELHEELQCLERSNSALHKEIAALKKDLQLYTTALERHEPFCRLKDSTSSPGLTASPSSDCQTGPSTNPPTLTKAAAPAPSTSSTSGRSRQTFGRVRHFTSSTSTTPTVASSPGSSSELFPSSSSTSVPYSCSFSTVPALHSLFRPEAVTPTCTSLLSNPEPSSSLATAAQPQSRQGADATDPFLLKQTSLLTALSGVAPPFPLLATENTGLVAPCHPTNVPQPHQGHFRGGPATSSPLSSLLPPTLQDPALRSFSVTPQASPEMPPASAFASKPSYSRHATSSSLLSLLTVPSPLDVPQTTSSTFDPPLSQPQPLADPSRDLSLSELLEFNEWILQ